MRVFLLESIDEELYNARNSINTSPSDKQKKAGNYKMGHVVINGYDITIENPKWSWRTGCNKKGHHWSVRMKNDYGYFRKTKGKDGDAIDVFIGDALESKKIFVIDQKLYGKFDESKVMFCFPNEQEAKNAYLSNYEEDWKGFWKITEVDDKTFRKWLYDGHRQRKPFAEYVEIINANKKKDKMKISESQLQSLIRNCIKESIEEANNNRRQAGVHAAADHVAKHRKGTEEEHKKAVDDEMKRRLAKQAIKRQNQSRRMGTTSEFDFDVNGELFENKLSSVVNKVLKEAFRNRK